MRGRVEEEHMPQCSVARDATEYILFRVAYIHNSCINVAISWHVNIGMLNSVIIAMVAAMQ